MNLESKTPNKNLWMGLGVHEALAAYYAEPKRTRDTLIGAYDKWCTTAKARLAENPWAEERMQEYFKELELGLDMLEHYALWAPKRDANFEIKEAEVRIQAPLPFLGNSVYLEGTADLLVSDGVHHWLVEHKTSSQIPDSEVLVMDEQFLTYLWGTRMDETFADCQPIGTIYNFLRKKAPTHADVLQSGMLARRKNLATTFEVYKQDIINNGDDPQDPYYYDMLKMLYYGDQSFFVRHPLQRSEHAIMAFGSQVLNVINEMLDPAIAIYPAPDWFKCKFCSFRAPCYAQMTGVNPAPMLAWDYQPREPRWSDVSPVDEE